jgi:hypothetical protein
MNEWIKREGLNRAMVDGRLPEKEYKAEMAEMQDRWVKQEEKTARSDRKALCDRIADEADAFFDKWLAIAAKSPSKPLGNEKFHAYWRNKNEALGKDRRIAY